MSESLWSITEDLKALDELIEQQQGEICEITEEFINEIDRVLTSKTDGCAEFVLSLEEQSNAVEKRIAELKELQRRLELKRARFLIYIQECMMRIGREKTVGSFYQFSIRKNPPSLFISDENKIPPAFLSEKTEVVIDKKAILDALKKGEIVEGAEIAPIKKRIQLSTKSTSKEKKNE